MTKRFSCQRALELIFEESQAHSDVEEEDVSKYDHLDVNSECSDSESEFEDGLHSEYAPQGAPQVATGPAQEPATGRASQTYLSKNGLIERSSSPVSHPQVLSTVDFKHQL